MLPLLDPPLVVSFSLISLLNSAFSFLTSSRRSLAPFWSNARPSCSAFNRVSSSWKRSNHRLSTLGEAWAGEGVAGAVEVVPALRWGDGVSRLSRSRSCPALDLERISLYSLYLLDCVLKEMNLEGPIFRLQFR